MWCVYHNKLIEWTPENHANDVEKHANAYRKRAHFMHL